MKKAAVIALHLGYWIMFLILLFAFYRLSKPITDRLRHPAHLWRYLLTGFAIVPGLISFYSFYTFLFTKLLSRKRILALFVAGAAVVIVAALAGGLTLSWVLFRRQFMFADGWRSATSELEVMALGAFVNGIIGLVMRGFITWYGDIKLKEELAKSNFNMEMALIKAQVNPHFLFNTINNIDVLIEKDAAKASAYLNKLSDIMRYMLYETRASEVSLDKELAYIRKYIDLQKIRTANPDYVQYTVEGNPAQWSIAPMLFIAFIENAFKHAENKKVEHAIIIHLKIEREQIIFDCSNAYGPATGFLPGSNGLGNELIQRRLALLYPHRHRLNIDAANNRYNVKLCIYRNAH